MRNSLAEEADAAVLRHGAARSMPAAFIGHGNPMNALANNRYTAAWQEFGATVPTPRAILVISAHWYTNTTAVTAMPAPHTIHDFFGFPQRLFDVQYPAPGLPELADEISDIVEPSWVGADRDSWGIDHGTWSVLMHAFPQATVPVVQLSIDANKPLDYHFDLGAKLEPLRRRGVLIVASGNVVHNLGRVDRSMADRGFGWAQRFDEAARKTILTKPTDMLALDAHRDFSAAVPTPDHYIPAVYFAGLAGAAGSAEMGVLVDGFADGALSMAAYTLGMSDTVD